MDFDEIDLRMKELVNALAPSIAGHTDLEVLESLMQAGEWGVALEILCDQLYDFDTPITRNVYHEIPTLACAMKLELDRWEMLKNLVR